MGSFNRFRSAHQADIKGKGILYEDDDEPIKLVDRDDSFVIKEFGLSLIGKVLNPKKQNVEKLLQTMPSQWGLSERITANDLGNGKFLLNFIGAMLIEVDSRPPKFSRKVEYEGDEVTIEIKYDKLFKHCTICGLLSHEKGYCPSMDVRSRLQHVERPDFFPESTGSRYASPSQQSSLQTRELQSSRYYMSKPVRYDDKSTRGQGPRYWENDSSRGRHSDRIIRSRDDHLRRNRYSRAQDNPGPYVPKRRHGKSNVREIVPYEQSPEHKSRSIVDLADMRSGEKTSNRKLASTIMTPVRADHPMEENVTLRDRGEARALAFSPNGEPSHADDLIIGALSDMEIMEQSMDLLGLDLMELEDRQPQPRSLQVLGRRAARGHHGLRSLVRNGSPSKRSTATVSHVAEGGEKPRRHRDDKEKASKHDGHPGGMEIS
ncbi:hypothetical protein Bca52824_074958 [Brassica carinata]|uniref:Zinc knuckle CX2CX4HX4C domain-containing protein n=1 Tax=Brassica carinata TaxID=52824 RepID=A0A8X7PNL4_BRACI|nr:hypothetical protein Bca52824_074958 [Brassica carinata]